ncbi:MAG TPA: hypothetical protein VFS43_13155 [Polyangiaceae bacterium]|nr:hypothetical protein [Polyangiaceae bacterium]
MSSCTFIFDDSVTQCDVDGDCQRRFADSVCNLVTNTCERKPIDEKWGCLDGPPLQPTATTVDLRLEVVGAITRTAAVGALVRACNRIDTTCSTPLVPDTPVGASGQVIMGVGENFNGYFEIRSPPAEPTKYVPEILYLPTREIVRREGPVRRALLFTEAEGQSLIQLVGGTFTQGQTPNAAVIATALDCQGTASPGISFELTSPDVASDQTVTFYTDRNNLPRTVATETSETGTYALTNLLDSSAAGTVALQATINSLGRTMGNDSVAIVRDNWITVIYVAP